MRLALAPINPTVGDIEGNAALVVRFVEKARAAGADVVGFLEVALCGERVKVGLAICEDLWKGEDAGFASRYLAAVDPIEELAKKGAELLIAPSASPFVLGKGERHRSILRGHAMKHGLNVASVNQLGGN